MAFKSEPLKRRANFYSIKDATFRLPTSKDDAEAIRREYTNPKTNEEGVAYERAYKALYGVIGDIKFTENTLKDGTVLRSINIELGEDEEGVAQIVSIPTDSRYTTDFLKKLPLIDLNKEVRLQPYDFEKDGPRQVGISVFQLNSETDEFTVKIPNNFFTKVEEVNGEKKYTNLHGFPEPTDEDSSDWPFYFKKVNKFLISYAKTNILTKFNSDEVEADKFDADKAFDAMTSEEATPKATLDKFKPKSVKKEEEVSDDEIPF